MILHVTFSDGSNPYVSYPKDRHAAAKQWRLWMKNHPLTAYPKIYCGNYMVQRNNDFSGYWAWKRGEFNATKKFYKNLGSALKYIEKMEDTQ